MFANIFAFILYVLKYQSKHMQVFWHFSVYMCPNKMVFDLFTVIYCILSVFIIMLYFQVSFKFFGDREYFLVVLLICMLLYYVLCDLYSNVTNFVMF